VRSQLSPLHNNSPGGIAVTLVGHPFDTLKVRLQTQPVDKPLYSEFLWVLGDGACVRMARVFFCVCSCVPVLKG
jgi:hypothetical protein